MKKSHWYDWILGLAGLLIMGLATFYILLLWNTFQKQIPVSYSFWGIPRITAAYGNHGPIRDTLVTGWIITLLLTFVGLFPTMWESGLHLLEEERAVVVPKVRTMIETIKLEMAVYYAYLMIQTANSKKLFPPTKLLLIIVIAMTLGYTIFKVDQALHKQKKKSS